MLDTVAVRGASLKELGLGAAGPIHVNLNEAALYEASLARREGQVAQGGALVVTTGEHTGRSAKDKFVVRDAETESTVWWDNNASMTPAHFALLWDDMRAHAAGRELFVQELFGGADPAHRIGVRVITELAWHSLFIRHLLRRPTAAELADFHGDFTIVNMPSFRADPKRHGVRSQTVIAVNFGQRLVLIGGTSYAGETKKSVFSILNYLLPAKGVMPMHCSVNDAKPGAEPQGAAIFFGLSGTGKTTLSADPARVLIGDDEHGWSDEGLFNFEGGCYAKMIKLSATAEPEIFATTRRWGTVLENVVMDPATRLLDLDDASLAENSRGAYPINAIPNASETGRCGQPTTLVMLTCDAFGVMPPIARLTPAQAMYHFLSGYTAKVAGTEKGVTEPSATFSTCFGAPFMPRHPVVYGDLLRARIKSAGVRCFLVNTGWTGGPYGVGSRMPIKETRALLNAALTGALDTAEYRTDANFGFEVPVAVAGVSVSLLDPRSTWANGDAYDTAARNLASMFAANFERFEAHVDADVRAAGPQAG